MVVNFEGSIINIRDKLAEAKKVRQENRDNTDRRALNDRVISKQKFADIIEIKKENKLAANISAVESDDEIQDILRSLKYSFKKADRSALKAHSNIETDRVMKFYPFE